MTVCPRRAGRLTGCASAPFLKSAMAASPASPPITTSRTGSPRWANPEPMAAALDVLTGDAIEPALPDIARLRIAVFRDFPYLYDGSLDYEREYLSAFAVAPGAVIVVVRDGGRIVGASTGLPLAAEHAAFRDPVARAGIDVGQVFYCAESVLLPDYRGRGFGGAFFDVREAHARALGLRMASFCAVIRPAD